MLKKKADGVMLTVWLFTLTYTISYITRINYGAVISEMEAASGIARSVLSMALTGSFFTYGTGQIISGFLGDRISPKRLVSVGLITTVVMNLLIPVCPSPYLMAAVWCVNGFAQSLMWPPLVRLMNALFTDEQYKMATTKVILKKSVNNLGHAGDIVEVKLGYARNYLIPQGLAFAWSKGAAAQAEAMKRARLAKAVATREGAVEAKGLIEGIAVEIPAKVSESGKLFGGISNEQIAKALSDKVAVDPKSITVESIKTTGEFPATVALHPEITANFFVKVVAE